MDSWGNSAGAMSAALQMVTNGGDTEGLFHGAFMESGAVIPRGDITLGQQDYDDLVQATGCARAEDTLDCLRQVPFPVLKEAVNRSQTFLSYRVCHDLLTLLVPALNCIPVSEPCLGPKCRWNIP